MRIEKTRKENTKNARTVISVYSLSQIQPEPQKQPSIMVYGGTSPLKVNQVLHPSMSLSQF